MKEKIRRNVRIARYVMYRETIVDRSDIFWTFLGGLFGIGIIGFINSSYFVLNDNLFLIGSFGASAVLVYGATNSPLAQPRNLVGGHVISALVGVTMHKIIPGEVWLSSAVAVATAIVMMQITKTVHPPGGATALIANIGSEKVKALGYWYVLSPVLSGVLILLAVALVFNNIPRNRNYPYKRPKSKLLRRIYFMRK